MERANQAKPSPAGRWLGSGEDLAQLAAHGIAPEEAERQLATLGRPAAWATLERPCTLGDGIERLSEPELQECLEWHARAAAEGRVSAFIPASGAATRMFKELLTAREIPGPLEPGPLRADASAAARALTRFVDELPRFAFAGALGALLTRRGHVLDTLRERGPWRPLLEAFLDPDGMDAARLPKGLLAFHREAGEVRTAFEEHLVEACVLTGDARGVRRLDVTVSTEHREGFERLLAQRLPALSARYPGEWRVRFSGQHPATDTLAADPSGGPFRDDRGRLVFRPAGHGALLRNLAETGGDLVFLKNIDNVAAARLRSGTEPWSRALVGLAASLADQSRRWRERLEETPGDAQVAVPALGFARSRLGLPRQGPLADLSGPALAAWFDRPIRVCGMVPNTGEPGGGPFWSHGPDGVSRQVVESAQVDMGSPEQAARFRASTHFNPVFMAVSLRDWRGLPYDLARFVDESAAIVTRKSHGGRGLLALERPGLWNGAMAGWHTTFVEVPLGVFNPVKTVFDLLRPEHQER
jgi:hypothetical protein